jgi:hypothetical protein
MLPVEKFDTINSLPPEEKASINYGSGFFGQK